ncbi:MAG TPA: hypothetical protein EYQ50_25775 [Verrucomicrobiales bacterium]|nr:hypothetical protein [Verrucomicrobiales bacterium]HIL71960.1 hypothetical protein [Verrucomicrobiota bacterium]
MNQRIHERHAVENFVEYYNTGRAHQSLGNKMINPGIQNMPSEGKILCDPRLGEMLKKQIPIS